MTKVKVAEATDTVLDYMVAVALGGTEFWFDTVNTYWIKLDDEDRALSTKWSDQQNFAPTALWAHGGLIIEREGIGMLFDAGSACRESAWFATPDDQQVSHGYEGENFDPAFMVYEADGCYGPTALVAAMRCFVTSKLGPEVEVPDVLVRVS